MLVPLLKDHTKNARKKKKQVLLAVNSDRSLNNNHNNNNNQNGIRIVNMEPGVQFTKTSRISSICIFVESLINSPESHKPKSDGSIFENSRSRNLQSTIYNSAKNVNRHLFYLSTN